MPAAQPWSANRLAARAVALRTDLTHAERRELLAALGLLTDDGHGIRPDPRRVTEVGREDTFTDHGSDSFTGLKTMAWEKPALLRDRTALPPGLRGRVPTPDPVAPVQRATCGSPAGRSAHQKRGEPLCQPCRVAFNAYQAERRAKRRAAQRAAAGEAA